MRFVWSADEYCLSFHCTVVADLSVTDSLKLTYLVGQNDLSGRPNRPLIVRPKMLDMFNFWLKNPTDLLFGWRL